MGQQINLELLQIFIEDARDAFQEWERVCIKLTPADEVSQLEPLLRCAHNLKGGAALIGLDHFRQKMHQFEDFLTELKRIKTPFTPELTSVLLQMENFVHTWVDQLKTTPDYIPDSKQIDALLLNVLERLQTVKNTKEPDAAHTPMQPTPAVPAQADAVKGDETLRVSAAKLNQLIQLAGELSLHHSVIDRASREGTLNDPRIQTVIDVKSKLTQDLQDIVLSLRMVPVENLFQRTERVVRQTASDLGKTVSVIRTGDEVTMDKVVADRMHEPLLHLARNAVDHGLEFTNERKASGKSELGTIRFTAESTSSGVNLTFEDDGRGIDPDKVYKKAVEMKLITANEEMSREARLRLIFLPGFSTAGKVTELSGRGVGMDVVNEVVQNMGGRVDLQSEIGKGTRFSISLPTNLALINALVIRVDGCQYAVPTQDMREVLDLAEFNSQPVKAGRGKVIDLRGEILPLERLSSFLPQAALKTSKEQPASGPAIVVQHMDNAIALGIDSVIGQQQIFVRPVISSLAAVSFFTGSTILSDGEPSMILNLNEVARKYFENSH